MAKKGKKTKQKNFGTFVKRLSSQRGFWVIVISAVLIILLFGTIYQIRDAEKRRYDGFRPFDENENYPSSELNLDAYYIDEYFFRSYDDGTITSRRGIDVSEYQEEIDWAAVKEAGVDFAMIRVGFRGYDKGKIRADYRYKENIKGALNNGIDVGLYFFSQAISVDEAIEEAAFVVDIAKNYKITMPIAIDMEDVTGILDRTYFLSKEEVTVILDAFCSVVENYGYDSLIYGNPSWINKHVNLGKIPDRRLWLAHYIEDTAFSYRYEIWQYSEHGKIDGISTDVDLDIQYIRPE